MTNPAYSITAYRVTAKRSWHFSVTSKSGFISHDPQEKFCISIKNHVFGSLIISVVCVREKIEVTKNAVTVIKLKANVNNNQNQIQTNQSRM